VLSLEQFLCSLPSHAEEKEANPHARDITTTPDEVIFTLTWLVHQNDEASVDMSDGLGFVGE
jgi:hypothetical protein